MTAFTAAIDQLQQYVTWRDTKTVFVIFNRNKGFSDVVQKAREAVRAHPQYKSGPLVQGLPGSGTSSATRTIPTGSTR
ncbi:hypothetical protein AAFG07_34725 [Bradyrhizobium sp. B097]|uniref:hypothetical protein n=1 Tax=Bradyrhizobium sp. B097 TaxID=3140244 RepID=UPI003182F30D